MTAEVAKRGPDGPLCSACYERTARPVRQCGRCGEIRRIQRRATASAPDLCRRCHPEPVGLCAGCDRERPCRRVAGGPPLCGMCRPRRLDTCALCGELRSIDARWPLGGVCRTCYQRARTHPTPCSSCHEVRVLVANSPTGMTCGPCAGSAQTYLCRTCGGSEELYQDSRCVRCVLTDRLRAQFSVQGNIIPELLPLVDAIAATHRPRFVLAWLDHSDRGADALTAIAHTGRPITHEALDALPVIQTQAVRHMLVHAGVLPGRDEHLERLPGWLVAVVNTAPEPHRHLLHTCGSWWVIRRARNRARRRRTTSAAANLARNKVQTALRFLIWIDDRGTALGAVTQSDVDAWLDGAPANRRLLADFLAWTNRHGLTHELKVPTSRRTGPDLSMTDDERARHLRRAVTNDTIPIDVRAAAALLFLYGLPVSHIARIRIDDLVIHRGQAHLMIQRHPTVLPPVVHRLIRAAADAGQPRSTIGRVVPSTQWLFPGQRAGLPLAGNSLAVRLRRHQFPILPGRNAARLELAGEIPAAALSVMLGISLSSAVHWARRANRDWNAFVQARPQQSK
jgi:hypothetical protein